MKIKHILFAFLMIPCLTWSQDLKGLDDIGPFSEGLAPVRKGEQWGFIDKNGTLVIDFRSDLVWKKEADKNRNDVAGIRYPQFKDGLCMIQQLLEEEQVPVYGFMDKSGNVVIEPEYLNITEFNNGLAVGILFTKTFRGENRFKLRIYDHKFSEVILNTSGEILRLIEQRNNIQMSQRRYTLPSLQTRILAPDLLAVKGMANTWEIRKVALQ